MLSIARLPSLVGLVVLTCSLLYLFNQGTFIQANFESSDLWRSVAESAQSYNYAHAAKSSPPSSHTRISHVAPASSSSASASASSASLSSLALPHDHHQHAGLASPAATAGCPERKPNLVISAIDGDSWNDQIFIFMQSLDLALGEEHLVNARQHRCPAAAVEVKIIVPKTMLKNLTPGFKALLKRYPSLEFVGALPEMRDVPVVLRRFQGWANYVTEKANHYDRVLVCDLDVAFQRNPFGMPMDPDVEILYFAEWRGLKIGQCNVHVSWFDHCQKPQSGSILTQQEAEAYHFRDRICAGSVYGTARAIAVYTDTMAKELKRSHYECNDQAMHIHIYYSSILDNNLRTKGLGRVHLVPNADALLGSIGTTPMVAFNEWGEILNERGVVQYAIHQYKTHTLLSDIIWRRYGWLNEVGLPEPIPTIPRLIEDVDPDAATPTDAGEPEATATATTTATADAKSGVDLKLIRHETEEAPATELKRFHLQGLTAESCGTDGSLCSCKYDDCLVHYEWY